MTNPTICKEKIVKVNFNGAGLGHAFIVTSLSNRTDAALAAADAYANIADALSKQSMEIVHERIFGSLSVEPAIMAARDEALRVRGISPHSPITYIQGNPPWGEGFAGVLIRAVNSGEVWTITDDGAPCGRGWRRNGSAFMVLQNLQGCLEEDAESVNTPALQAWRMIERAERILREQGATYHDVVHTWFYLNDMLNW